MPDSPEKKRAKRRALRIANDATECARRAALPAWVDEAIAALWAARHRKDSLAHYYRHHEVVKERARVKEAKRRSDGKTKDRKFADMTPEQQARKVAVATEWNRRNRIRRREIGREFYRNNKSQWKAAKAVRRARIQKAGGMFTANEVETRYWEQGGYCAYCWCPLDGEFHAEHVIPLARGGSNDIANIACSCASCNLRKGTLTGDEFVAKLRAA